MKKPFTLEQIKKSAVAKLNPHLFEKAKKPIRKGKYKSTRTKIDGIVFDSKKEANRYKELLTLRKAGEIGLLELQVAFELNQGGTHSVKYIADFVYLDCKTGLKVVEDTKGYRTAIYKKKKRLMKKVHGIIIKET